MSVALGRHGAVRQAAEEDTGGAGGRAGAERAASSVTVVPSRQRVRRELGKTPFNAILQNPLWIFWFFFVPERL
jgi:hypothetical protein